jgi:non-specific serine/threonine protein kinase
VAQERGRTGQEIPLLEEALALMRQAQDKAGVALILNVLGEHVRAGRDFARAAELYRESLALSRSLESPFWISVAAANLSTCLIRLGRPAEALPLAREALTTAHAIGNKRNVPPMLLNFVALAALEGKPEPAAVLLGAVERFLREQGTVLVYADRGEHEECARAVREALDGAAYDAALARGRALSLDAAVARALALSEELAARLEPAAPAPRNKAK